MGETAVPLSDRKRLAHLVKSTRQHEVLLRLVHDHAWRIGAEIGVLRGKTLFALLDGAEQLTMFGVDQWKRLPLRDDENAETYHDFDMQALSDQVMCKAARYGGRCMILKGSSPAMAEKIDDGSLDFVFIDGDHTEIGVTRDILAWAPKVTRSGMVLGHDCHWTTVKRVIDRLCPGWISYGEAVWGIARTEVRLDG